MLKKLVLTTMLVSPVAALAVESGKLDWTLGGNASFNAITADQKVRQSQAGTLGSDGELFVKVRGKTNNGMTYGFTSIMTMDPSATSTFEENYVTLAHDAFGTFELGAHDGVEDILFFDGSDVMGGTGGFDGKWSDVFVNMPGNILNSNVLADTGNAVKMTWISPTYAGFQMGVSYTPDSGQIGNAKQNALNNTNYTSAWSTNNVALALNYQNNFDGLDVGLFVTGMTGRAHNQLQANGLAANGVNKYNHLKDVKMVNLGATLGYGDFAFGAGYVNNFKSFVPAPSARTGQDAGKSWNVAGSYKFGHGVTAAIGYLSGRTKIANAPTSTTKITSLTVDWNIAPGLLAYVEGNFIREKSSQAALNAYNSVNSTTVSPNNLPSSFKNNGKVYLIGTKVSF